MNAMTLSEVLTAALDDEYQARAKYEAILDAYGPVAPFDRVVESEGRHIEELLALFAEHGLQPPEDHVRGTVAAPPSLGEACLEAVQAEQENAALYERLLADTREPDVRRVLDNLRRASQERHLPAFRRCVQRLARPVAVGEAGAARAAIRSCRGDGARRQRRRQGRGQHAGRPAGRADGSH